MAVQSKHSIKMNFCVEKVHKLNDKVKFKYNSLSTQTPQT